MLVCIRPNDDIEVRSYGNLVSATAFLMGLASEDLRPHTLDHVDRIIQSLPALA